MKKIFFVISFMLIGYACADEANRSITALCHDNKCFTDFEKTFNESGCGLIVASEYNLDYEKPNNLTGSNGTIRVYNMINCVRQNRKSVMANDTLAGIVPEAVARYLKCPNKEDTLQNIKINGQAMTVCKVKHKQTLESEKFNDDYIEMQLRTHGKGNGAI